jgi:hypothetical protein
MFYRNSRRGGCISGLAGRELSFFSEVVYDPQQSLYSRNQSAKSADKRKNPG